MLKKFFSYFGIICLSLFSFYYTQLSVELVMEKDPIMIEIKEVAKEYEKEAIDAILIDNNIIPGISGTKVDAQASFKKMKSYGKFNQNLFVFEEVTPTISTENNYDKYIISGNQSIRNVSLLFKIENTSYIEELVEILSQKQTTATFFITTEIINNSPDIIKLLYLSNQEIELLATNDTYTYGDIRSSNNFLKSYITKKLNYCYTPVKNDNIIQVCSKMKLHTVLPTIITNHYPYSEVKEQLTSGAIITFNNDDNGLRELPYVINYIVQNNYKIVPLKELLQE